MKVSLIQSYICAMLLTGVPSVVSAQDKLDEASMQVQRVESILSNERMVSAMKHSQIIRLSGDERYIDVCMDGTADLGCLEQYGAVIGSVAGDVVTARIPVSRLKEFADNTGVTSLSPARKINLALDAARSMGNVDPIRNPSQSGLPDAFDGTGVIIGIIDQGFEFNHLAFLDAGKKTSRVSRVWNQLVDTVPSVAPKGYAYGVEYVSDGSVIPVEYDTQGSAHGTHVAGIAAGSNPGAGAPYTGVAPAAEIVLVSFNGVESGVIDAVKYIFDYAESIGKPCVINLSLGTNLGPHDGTSKADRAIDAMVGPGRIVVGAVGNSGTSRPHFSKTFKPNDNTASIALQYKYRYSAIGGVEVWGEPGQDCRISVSLVDKATNRTVISSPVMRMNVNAQKMIDYRTGLPTGKDSLMLTASILTGVSAVNNRPYAMIDAVGKNADKDQYFTTITVQATSGTVHMWADDNYSQFVNMGNPEFLNPDNEYSVSELGGSGRQIVSVGAYVSKNQFTTLGGGSGSTAYNLKEMAPFTSLGPTIDNRVKPEVTAPGSTIISAYNRYYASFKATNMVGSAYTSQGRICYYGSMSGTSMSTPFVTGTVALWLQANPMLTPDDVREVIRHTALQDAYTRDTRTAGYGKIDALGGLRYLIKNTGIDNIDVDDAESLVAGTCVLPSGVFRISFIAPLQSGVTYAVYDAMGRLTDTGSAREGLSELDVKLASDMSIIKVSQPGLKPMIFKALR